MARHAAELGKLAQAHIGAAKAAADAGKLLLAGAYGSPPTGATLIWSACIMCCSLAQVLLARQPYESLDCRQNTSTSEIEAFIKGDSYVQNNLVTHHEIRPFAVAVKAFKE